MERAKALCIFSMLLMAHLAETDVIEERGESKRPAAKSFFGGNAGLTSSKAAR